MSFRAVPIDVTDVMTAVRRVGESLTLLADGRSNAFGTVTLTVSVTSTTLTDRRIGTDSVITLMPTTANAAGALATTYIGTVTAGSATITHANNAQADRTFSYAITG